MHLATVLAALRTAIAVMTLAGAPFAFAGSTSHHSSERDNYSRQSAAWEYHNRMANGFWDTSWGGGGNINVSGEWQIEKLAKSLHNAYLAFQQKRSDAFAAKVGQAIVADDKTWEKYTIDAGKRTPWVSVPDAINNAGGALAIARAAAVTQGDAVYERVFTRAIAAHNDASAMEYAIWLQSQGTEGATRAIAVLEPWCPAEGTAFPSQCTELGLAYWGGLGTRVNLSLVREYARRAWAANESFIYAGNVWLARYHMLQGIVHSISPADMDETKRAIAHFSICFRDHNDAQCIVPLINMLSRQKLVVTTINYDKAEALFKNDDELLAYAKALVDHGDVDYYARGKAIIERLATKGGLPALTLQNHLQYQELPKEKRCTTVPRFEELARLGSPPAMRELALMKDNGTCMPQDTAAANALLEKAAPLDPMAKGMLAVRLFEGKSMERDRDRAFELLAEAADAGDEYALFQIGYAYWVGNYVGMDREEARPYLERAAAMGHMTAAEILAKAPTP